MPLPNGTELEIRLPGQTVAATLEGPQTELVVSSSAGPRGPAGVVVIESDETEPPAGTPVGTVIYKKV